MIFIGAQYLFSFILIPLVLIMAHKVRNTILRMPEAPGDRKGKVGVGKSDISILCIGESPIAGVGLSNQKENFTYLLANKIHTHINKTVEWHILGKTGIQLAELYPTFMNRMPNKASVVFICMGVNDCKEGTSMFNWQNQWKKFHERIRNLYPNALIVCSSIPPFKSFPSLPFPVRTFLKYRSDLMNKILKMSISNIDDKTIYLPLPDILSHKYFADDGFHPNAIAHKKWGEGIYNAIIQREDIIL